MMKELGVDAIYICKVGKRPQLNAILIKGIPLLVVKFQDFARIELVEKLHIMRKNS